MGDPEKEVKRKRGRPRKRPETEEPGRTPGTAEGDRETVEQNLDRSDFDGQERAPSERQREEPNRGSD